jgi:hypothetical protein
VARERLRAQAAFGSLARLGIAADEIAAALRAVGEFVTREGLPAAADPPVAERARERRPVRAVGAPLETLRHLLPGWRDLARAEREAWRAFEDRVPGGTTTLELAWYAADGERTVDRIARLVWVESGVHAPAAIETFFEWTARLGLARLEA